MAKPQPNIFLNMRERDVLAELVATRSHELANIRGRQRQHRWMEKLYAKLTALRWNNQ